MSHQIILSPFPPVVVLFWCRCVVAADADGDAQRHPIRPRDDRSRTGEGRGRAHPRRARYRRPQRSRPRMGAHGIRLIWLRRDGESSLGLGCLVGQTEKQNGRV